MSTSGFLFSNGVISQTSDAPPVTSFLETHPGAYTTTRTHNNASCILFWERHVSRLIHSAKILLSSHPQLLFGPSLPPAHLSTSLLMAASAWESSIPKLVDDSMSKVLPIAMKDRKIGTEFAILVLLGGNSERLRKTVNFEGKRILEVFDVHIHIGTYIPPAFGARKSGAHLALVGRGRIAAAAKYSEWISLRKPLERLRPPSTTELLLSNDGDHILEGAVTNFFVICRKEDGEDDARDKPPGLITFSFEVQTAPVSDGVLPGIIRHLVIEVCLSKGIPFREVAPSWSMHERWEEAFITNGLRLLQHVERILIPCALGSPESKIQNGRLWTEKCFEDGPGTITRIIQKEIMEKALLEGRSLPQVS